ncbi:MAG: M23 family metallopeptidase [Bryobacterales bacterium]|nr:M23 family metallopeptidase [Bryobacterales bacterium]
MNQPYFIVVLAHSLHGRLRRIHVAHTVVYAVLGLALLGCFSLFGFVSSYARMAWKVANYNSLRQEIGSLRQRYDVLQKANNQTNQDLATLQVFASEVSIAYGIKRRLEGPTEISMEGRLVPTVLESLDEYNFLKSANFSRFHRRVPAPLSANARPGLWPVDGRLLSFFGRRDDPFSSGFAFHAGVDISAFAGTPVKVAADGVVIHTEYWGAYGRTVVVDHGRGVQTYYAHLSRFSVIAGQEVHRGDIVGLSGASGRVTSPHLHYEVRVGGNPVNPYPYLKAVQSQTARRDFPF